MPSSAIALALRRAGCTAEAWSTGLVVVSIVFSGRSWRL